MKAADIMTRNPSVVTPGDPLTRAAEIMRDLNVGFVPVVSNVNTLRLEGVLTDRDIVVRCVAEHHGSRCQVRDHMSTNHVDTVTPDTDVNDVVALMERDRVRRIPVLSDGGRLEGVIAQADLARRVGPSRPELVAELVESISQPYIARR